jgi:hypothetical protein
MENLSSQQHSHVDSSTVQQVCDALGSAANQDGQATPLAAQHPAGWQRCTSSCTHIKVVLR